MATARRPAAAHRPSDQNDLAERLSVRRLSLCGGGLLPPKARRGRIHPATRTFQALRIAVNDELGVLDRLLQQAPEWLEPDGLLGIISFHSLKTEGSNLFLRDERQRITRKPAVATPEKRRPIPVAAVPSGAWPVGSAEGFAQLGRRRWRCRHQGGDDEAGVEHQQTQQQIHQGQVARKPSIRHQRGSLRLRPRWMVPTRLRSSNRVICRKNC